MQNSDNSTPSSPNSPSLHDSSIEDLGRTLDDVIAAYQREIQKHSLLIARQRRTLTDKAPGPSADFLIRKAA